MKKHRTFQNIEKKETKSRTGLYLSIFLATIMIGGVAGILLDYQGTSNDYVYGKYTFKQDSNGRWSTKIDGKQVSFFSLPTQSGQMNISAQAIQTLKNSQGILISINPDSNVTTRLQALELFRFELFDSFSNAYQKQTGFGVMQKSEAYKLPVITCSNSTYQFPVITARYSNETKISEEGSCIDVKALDEQSMLIELDSMKYRIYGVI